MELDSTEMMKRFVMAGLGIDLPGGVQLPGGDCGRQTARDAAGAGADGARRLGLIYRKDKALSKAALGFIQVVLEKLGNYGKGSDRASPGGGGVMTCMRCRKEFADEAPHAPTAASPTRMPPGMFQTSTVLISTGGEDGFTAPWRRSRRSCAAGC